jgi:hypothetical protein
VSVVNITSKAETRSFMRTRSRSSGSLSRDGWEQILFFQRLVFGDSEESFPPFFLFDFPLADFDIKKEQMNEKKHRNANIDIVAGKKELFSRR